jgi:hypothetical protein
MEKYESKSEFEVENEFDLKVVSLQWKILLIYTQNSAALRN